MLKYYGRKKELALLEEKYKTKRFEFGYLYGQRRIGKTTLMEMFRKDKKSLFFFATDSEDIDIRRQFTSVLNKATNSSSIDNYSSWYSFFEAIDSYFEDDLGLMVIDEFPNIVLTRDGKRKRSDFASSLQAAIDTIFKHRKFMLVLTGSNVSFLEKEITDSKAPLYERNTFSLSLKKLEWDEASQALSSMTTEDKIKTLCLTNTFPYYLSLIDQTKSFEDNIDNLFYKQTAIFTDDPSKIITTDISTGGLYASIISNISRNNNTLKGLCEALVTDSSKMSKYINELINNDVLRKKKNFNSQRNITYEICDPMLAFYYRFIRENSELIKNGYGELIKKNQVNEIDNFVHRFFEGVCITYIEYLNKNGKLNSLYKDFYNCQYDNTPLGRSVELDIVAESGEHLLIGECKYSKNKRTKQDYLDILDDLSLPIFKRYSKKEIYLFGGSGFEKDLSNTKDSNLHLIDLKTMFKKN